MYASQFCAEEATIYTQIAEAFEDRLWSKGNFIVSNLNFIIFIINFCGLRSYKEHKKKFKKKTDFAKYSNSLN
jgi:hypothetical protein